MVEVSLSIRQEDAIRNAITRALSPFRVDPPMRCSDWARKYFWLAEESSAVSGRFDPWPMQVAILDCMGNDDISVVSFRKSARIGYTKMLTAACGYFHHHKKRNTVIYQPTDSDAREFCKDTIDPMIRDVACIAELLAGSGKNSKENTLQTKYFLGSSMHIRGGTSANNYRRLTKDVVVYDELDGFDSDIEGEGDPVSLGDKRVRDSAFPKSIRGTTPTIHNQSLIQKSEKEADASLRFYFQCPHCDEAQYFEWGGKDSDYGFKWKDSDPETVHYLCKECFQPIYYHQVENGLLDGGWWADEEGNWIDDTDNTFRDPEGNKLAWPEHICFILWSAYSLTFPWKVMVREFINTDGDPTLLKTFVNTTLGEYWRETLTEVDADPIYERREHYRDVPDEAACITYAADIQVDRIEIEFVAWGPGEESWSLDYRVIPGDTQRREVWDVLAKEIRREFKTESGLVVRPYLGCIDSGYLPDMVYEFSRRNGLLYAIPVKGANIAGKPIANMPRRPNATSRVYLTEVGSDTAKETLYRRLLIESPGRGYCHFPDTDAYDLEHFHQLTGEEKRPVKRNGRIAMAFQQVHSNVEALDCRVYNLAAIRIAQTRFRVNLDKPLVGGASRKGETEPAPEASKSAPDRGKVGASPRQKSGFHSRGRKRGGWMSKYRK